MGEISLIEVDVWSFFELPRRIFLDSSTLQTLQDYGSFIWEGEALSESARVRRDPQGLAKLETLKAIMFVNQRAMFEFALSENSLVEVSDKGDAHYMNWAHDVLDHWLICIEESGGLAPADEALLIKLDSGSFGYLGAKDRLLLKDAILFGCEAFLTMENRLPKNAAHLERALGIKVVTPKQYWELLRPWAKLYV
jgi:hypothetical protein